MMHLSGELMIFSVGGPRYFENNTIVECFDHWCGENAANSLHFIEVYQDCAKLYGSPFIGDNMNSQGILD